MKSGASGNPWSLTAYVRTRVVLQIMYVDRKRRSSRTEETRKKNNFDVGYDVDLIDKRQPESSCSSFPLLCIVVGLYAMVFGTCAEGVVIAAKIEGNFRASWWWATIPLFGAEAVLIIAQMSALAIGFFVFRSNVSVSCAPSSVIRCIEPFF